MSDTMTAREFKTLESELRDEGYVRYINPHDMLHDPDEECLACRGKIAYHTGFKRGNSYRAFAVCGECYSAFEF